MAAATSSTDGIQDALSSERPVVHRQQPEAGSHRTVVQGGAQCHQSSQQKGHTARPLQTHFRMGEKSSQERGSVKTPLQDQEETEQQGPGATRGGHLATAPQSTVQQTSEEQPS